MTSKGYEPAFPGTVQNSVQSRALGAPAFTQYSGMTLRDYFAAKAMQGDIASFPDDKDPADVASMIAERAYAIADAMLDAREQL